MSSPVSPPSIIFLCNDCAPVPPLASCSLRIRPYVARNRVPVPHAKSATCSPDTESSEFQSTFRSLLVAIAASISALADFV